MNSLPFKETEDPLPFSHFHMSPPLAQLNPTHLKTRGGDLDTVLWNKNTTNPNIKQ
jgi:hypothetical protein